jgi:hypothetical protein
MREFLFILLIITTFFSCKKDEVSDPVLSEDYGNGMYVVTSSGISYVDLYGNSIVENNIFQEVNSSSIVSPKSIKIFENRGYIVGNRLYVVDINTFGLVADIGGFQNSVSCDIVSQNRAFVLDKGESLIKVVDLDNFNIVKEIETGDSTKPQFIISKQYTESSFILNGGGVGQSKKDSTLVIVRYQDVNIPLSQISNVVELGYNPSSAVFSGDYLVVLCRGVFNSNDMSTNTESTIYSVHELDHFIQTNFPITLQNIYNADNIISNWDGSIFYFTANDASGNGGIYVLNPVNYNYNILLNVPADILKMTVEQYADSDTTFSYTNIMYMNDINNPNMIYKYNLGNSSFVDTLVFDNEIMDIQLKVD